MTKVTNTITYLVKDPNTKHCAVIDSVMDMDYAAGRITYQNADKIIDEIQDRKFTLDWIIETHVPRRSLKCSDLTFNKN